LFVIVFVTSNVIILYSLNIIMVDDYTVCKRCGHTRVKHAPPEGGQVGYGRCGECGEGGCMEFLPS
jgi:hypothetical protein